MVRRGGESLVLPVRGSSISYQNQNQDSRYNNRSRATFGPSPSPLPPPSGLFPLCRAAFLCPVPPCTVGPSPSPVPPSGLPSLPCRLPSVASPLCRAAFPSLRSHFVGSPDTPPLKWERTVLMDVCARASCAERFSVSL